MGVLGLFHHPLGWFAGVDASWFFQYNQLHRGNNWRGPLNEELPSHDFPMVNLFAGFRLPWQRGDVTVGLMNLTGEDYQLNPLSDVSEMPREPTVMTRFRLVF